MKKLLLTLILVISLPLVSFSQNNLSCSMGLGVVAYSIDTKSASPVGLNMSISFDKIYMDFSSNLASGKGEYLDFSSSETYSANKINVGVINIGYIISNDRFYIIPIIGYGWSKDIYQDPIGWDTYCYGKSLFHFNAGAVAGIKFNQIAIQGGAGIYEIFKVGVSYIF